jgi:hypothetical protein
MMALRSPLTTVQLLKRLTPLLAAPAALLLNPGRADAVLTYNIFQDGANVVLKASGSLSRLPLTCCQYNPPGSPGKLPPKAPTDPYVTLSRHTAPVIQPPPVHRANEQTSQAAAGRSAPEAHVCGDAFAVIAGASDAAMRSAPD